MTQKQNPHYSLLRTIAENASPAFSLDIAQGTDPDGWAVYITLSVGDLVSDSSGSVWRVYGFTMSNTVVLKPYGLGHDPLVHSVNHTGRGLSHVDEKQPELLQHKNGFVCFS